MDVSPNGLAKTNRLAEKRGVTIETIEADLNDFVFPEPMDVVYSIGTVQYLQPENWKRGFERFRRGTAPGGVHVIFAFVDHPNVPTPPDWTESEFSTRSASCGLLRRLGGSRRTGDDFRGRFGRRGTRPRRGGTGRAESRRTGIGERTWKLRGTKQNGLDKAGRLGRESWDVSRRLRGALR